MNSFITFLLVVAGLAALLAIGARYLESRLMYVPSGARVDPERIGLTGVKEYEVPASDSHKILIWYRPAEPGQPTILYFHGNGGSLADRADRYVSFGDHGRGVLMMSYRGFSGSSGWPSEAANVSDGKVIYNWLIEQGLAPDDIILYGESLGTGVAVQVAAARQVGGLILDAPYTSIVDVAELAYPFLPSRAVMRDRYQTMQYVGQIRCPALVIHGERDDVIPAAMGRAVAKALGGPVKLVTFPDAGHTDHTSYGSLDVVNSWIDQLISQDQSLAKTPARRA